MKLITITSILILFTSCSKSAERRPYRSGICVKERSRFMASYSPEAFEVYHLKKIKNNGYYTYRYNLKGKPMFYKWMSFSDARERDLSRTACPDKKEIIIFAE